LRRSVLSIVLGLAVVLVTLAAVTVIGSDSTSEGDDGRDATASTASPEPRQTTTTTRSSRGSGQPVTFAFGGDVHFEGGLRSQLANDPSGMFAPIAPELSAADVAVVNLETAITEGGTPSAKSYNFRAPASAFEALRVAGVDVVSMANNHGVDYGTAGLADTLAAKAGTALRVVGIGADAGEAYAPARLEVKGQRIAVFGASDVIDDHLITAWTATDAQGGIASTKGAEQQRLVDGIRAARPDTDTIVVYLHWGAEGTDCPSPRQRELARALVDAGADIVVGSHTHRVMTAGRLGRALVDYGLGNFVFYNESGGSGVTGVLTATATGRDIDAYAWKPARIQGGIPRLLSGDAAASDLAGFDGRRACTDLTP
jgi:poly-gamma-glutamate synthesis protein (capsule biosynthesis protein)